jgi:hypothetical protein
MKTQIETVKDHLLTKGGLSSMEAFRKYGITRLSQYILLLRKQYVITDNWVVPKNNGKNAYVVYEMGETKC